LSLQQVYSSFSPTICPSLISIIRSLPAFAYNGLGYVTTGNGGAGRFDDLWFFAPDKEQEDCD
jgi:hypothetical protein